MTPATSITDGQKRQSVPAQPFLLLQYVQWYFKFEQRISLLLIMTGLAIFLTGVYLALSNTVTAYYQGIGGGFIFTGFFTLLQNLLLHFQSQWHYVAACEGLAGELMLPHKPVPYKYTHKMQYYAKQRLRLWLVLITLLLLLHGAGLFGAGLIHAALPMNALHLICNEWRAYRFGRYWQNVLNEINKHQMGRPGKRLTFSAPGVRQYSQPSSF